MPPGLGGLANKGPDTGPITGMDEPVLCLTRSTTNQPAYNTFALGPRQSNCVEYILRQSMNGVVRPVCQS